VESNVKRMILTHFDASSYKTIQDRKKAEKKARALFPETKAAIDGLKIILN
jgi:ribonuclease BN (tRNA processing enzyme)